MSLRKSQQLTPPRLAAARQNAQQSTGPRSAAGKQQIKMNALKHGAYAAPENHHDVMRALGEDPEKYETLKRELMLTYGPGDALWQQQLEDLAKLYWRRQRLERMQTGLMRRALREVEERQHQREQEMAVASFPASRLEMLEVGLPQFPDPGVRARQRLSYLELIRAQVQVPLPAEEGPGVIDATSNAGPHPPPPAPQPSREIPPGASFVAVLEPLYRGGMGWRVARIGKLLRAFCGSHETVELAEPREAQQRELLALLDEEVAAVRVEFEYAEKQNREQAALELDACLAPAGETWDMMLRQETALDRSIDRKVRIIMAMRKDYTRLLKVVKNPPVEPGEEEARALNALLGEDFPFESSPEQDAAEASKMPEQSRNVSENKEPAAREARP